MGPSLLAVVPLEQQPTRQRSIRGLGKARSFRGKAPRRSRVKKEPPPEEEQQVQSPVFSSQDEMPPSPSQFRFDDDGDDLVQQILSRQSDLLVRRLTHRMSQSCFAITPDDETPAASKDADYNPLSVDTARQQSWAAAPPRVRDRKGTVSLPDAPVSGPASPTDVTVAKLRRMFTAIAAAATRRHPPAARARRYQRRQHRAIRTSEAVSGSRPATVTQTASTAASRTPDPLYPLHEQTDTKTARGSGKERIDRWQTRLKHEEDCSTHAERLAAGRKQQFGGVSPREAGQLPAWLTPTAQTRRSIVASSRSKRALQSCAPPPQSSSRAAAVARNQRLAAILDRKLSEADYSELQAAASRAAVALVPTAPVVPVAEGVRRRPQLRDRRPQRGKRVWVLEGAELARADLVWE